MSFGDNACLEQLSSPPAPGGHPGGRPFFPSPCAGSPRGVASVWRAARPRSTQKDCLDPEEGPRRAHEETSSGKTGTTNSLERAVCPAGGTPTRPPPGARVSLSRVRWPLSTTHSDTDMVTFRGQLGEQRRAAPAARLRACSQAPSLGLEHGFGAASQELRLYLGREGRKPPGTDGGEPDQERLRRYWGSTLASSSSKSKARRSRRRP